MSKDSLQADLNQRKEDEKRTFPATSGPCIERSAGAATLLTSGSFPILTRRRKSSASALQDFVTSLSAKKETVKSRVCHPLDPLLKLFFTD